MHNPTDRITHTTAFVTPVVEHWLEREIAQWVIIIIIIIIIIILILLLLIIIWAICIERLYVSEKEL